MMAQIDTEQIYTRLPFWLQNMACSLEGERIAHQRFGGRFQRVLTQVEARSTLSTQKIEEFRDCRMQRYLSYCGAHVPHYRALFASLGISSRDIRAFNDLTSLPILPRASVQRNTAAFRSEDPRTKRCVSAHTSGTAGSGLQFVTTRAAVQEQWAVWWRYRHWHGITRDTWCAYFGGRSIAPITACQPPFWRVNWPGRQILFSGYHMSPENLKHYVAELRLRRIPWLHGYPSLLALLAAYLVDSGQDLGYAVRWVTVGAENLMDQQAHLMNLAFGVFPIQHYGLAEAAANFSQCECGNLHVDEDFSAVEFIPNGDGTYRVVGTAFTNEAMAFVRYETDDIVVLNDQPCPCGRPGRLVTQIDGRREDYVLLRNGTRVGRLDHIFKDLVNVSAAQIVQKNVGVLAFRIVRGSGYSEEDTQFLLTEAVKRLGEDTDIVLEFVDSIPRTKHGKLRFVVSELDEASLTHAGRTVSTT